MVDEVTATRPGVGEPTFDPETGILTPPAPTVVYEGLCRMRQPTLQESEVMFGGAEVTRSRLIACMPHSASGLQVGDVVEFVRSDDVDLLGRQFRITAVPMMTFDLYKPFPCELVE